MSSNNGQSTSGQSTSGDTDAERQARLNSAYKALTGEDPSERTSDARTEDSSYQLDSYYLGKYDDDKTDRNTTTTTGSGDITAEEKQARLDETMRNLTGDPTSRYSVGATTTTRTPTQSVRSEESGKTVPFKLSPTTAEQLRKERERERDQ